MLCKCGSSKKYDECCEQYHLNHAAVPCAEVLMRSRYCAYAMQNADFILQTTHPSFRKGLSTVEILDWAKRNKWMGLEIIKTTRNTVEFKAHFLDERLEPQIHHEKSTFEEVGGKWYFVNGIYP